ncbi:NodT family efflux transporter outer membrane factor (OMF) lipoprotein [Sphingopyxis sp. OAS728]|uniref:efflux transporter outer membrane subunit n=1 Tax=Sphingopyxis sp. OAS728 TaxID=2663823 RepID=UPI001A0C08C9|nr:efflux transporter outer membrane subunit [Sphingopyxis sp. OAS728]MBE1529995.1 NodT family efflux transporter outer membrane factor (OMF) lipoprotein [Sphingopyxis sp. OAS728]
MKISRLALASALTAALTACAGPQVATTTVAPVAPPLAWRTDAGPSAALQRDWWRSFGDPTLTALVDAALANNSDIGVAAARVREARANVALARAQTLPAIDATLGGGRSRSVNAFGQPVEQNFAQPQLQVAYEVDLFGRLADQQSAARDLYLASEAAHDTIQLSIAAAVAGNYVVLRGLDARLEVARETVSARSESLRIAKSRVGSGYSPKLELEQAQAEYDATAQIVPQIELAIARTEDALSLLVGDSPRAIERGEALDRLTVPLVPDGLPSELLRRRPDVAQAEYQLAASDKNLSAARKRFLPQLRLTSAAGAAFSTLLGDPITIWSVGGSILAPIFQGGRLTAQADAAGAQRDQAAFAYRRTALTAFREVEDALAAVRLIDAQIAFAQSQRNALAEGLRLATNRYREGYSPYLEQLDAQRGLLGSELSLIQLHADALSARIQLFQAMGGGWTICEIPETSCATAPQVVDPS